MARCRVSFTDSEKLEHSAEAEAESLYEAVAPAVAGFREDPLPRDRSGDQGIMVIPEHSDGPCPRVPAINPFRANPMPSCPPASPDVYRLGRSAADARPP